MDTRKPRIAVVFGGRSTEHSVSCVTAASVLQALDTDRYDVVPVGITRTGRWVLESRDTSRFAFTTADDLPEVDGSRAPVSLGAAPEPADPAGTAGLSAPDGSGGSGGSTRAAVSHGTDGADASTGDGLARPAVSELVVQQPGSVPEALGEVDVVFPLLHGPWGEDGTLQGLLEMAGVRYVGAGVLASAAGMDKHYMKIVLQAAGLPVLPYAVITPRQWAADPGACAEAVDSLGYPVFVKPCRGGSSLGISKVHDRSGLEAAVETARAHDPKVLVEAAAEGGREIECGVLQGFGDNPPDTSVVAEITIGDGHEFYDFAAKYLPEEHTRLDVPADLPEPVVARVQELAVQAFEAFGCEGLARVDFFLLPDDRVVINEINTMPGFTPSSMFPRMWAATGLDYPALVDRLVQLALHRDTGLR